MTGGAFLTRWFQKLRPLAPNLLLNGRSKTFHFALYPCQERLDFVEQIDALKEQPLNVEDSVIDTESNLWYIVLQKNMYKIGLPTDMFDEFQADIDALVNRRNSIAHGNARSGVSQREFDNWETKTNSILSDIARQLYSFANNAKYLQTPDR